MRYDVVGESGPPHARIFEAKCTVFDPKIEDAEAAVVDTAQATGTSINRAKSAAGEIILSRTKLEMPTPEQIKKSKAGKF